MIDFSKMTIEEMNNIEDQLIEAREKALVEKDNNKIIIGTYINNNGSLSIGDEEKRINLASITNEGKAYFLNNNERRENRKKWINDRMYVRALSTEWKGKTYYINENFYLVVNDKNKEVEFEIYDFETCMAVCGVVDSNIRLYEDCKTIILY